MPIGSLLTAKDSASTYMPLLLCVISFTDGTVLRVSSHDVTYGGHAYLPRLQNQDITATQALGEQGIDVPASVNLRLADADYTLYSNYEVGHGFKGSRITITAVMYDALAGGFSSDSRVIFNGICKEPGGRMPSHDGKVLVVGFASRFNMTGQALPPNKIQKNCLNIFPATLAERQDGADNSSSLFYTCGYSPDATGANARGNLNSGVAYTTCAYTADDCRARGMFETDGAARVTGRFTGIQWNPPSDTQTVRNYISGKQIDVAAASNEARYGDVIPMLYGRAWTDPLVLNTIPDGNFVRMAALICWGQVDAILDVVVNDYHIPHTYDDDTESPISTGIGVPNATEAAKGGWWKCLNKGDRDGHPGLAGEDPYGSMCVLEIVVPHKVAAPGSQPRVRVYAEKGSKFPTDQIEDLLLNWAGWAAAELNSASFATDLAIDQGVITYSTGTRYRFTSSLYLRQAETVAEVLKGLRLCRRGMIGPDSTGLLRSRTEQTLALQQPAPISGSNYNTAVASKLADGTAANGYVAYRFDESNILGGVTVSLLTGGNKYSVQFQNADNLHSQDSLQAVDAEDIRRSDQEIPAAFGVRGVDNYDQLRRLIAGFSAKQLRGNSRSDTGGTVQVEFDASIRAVHLSVGDICMVNWQLLGLTNQLFRAVRIAPTTNFEQAKLALTWHVDDWFTDAYGQQDQPAFTQRHRDKLARPAYPWLPGTAQPETGDSLYSSTDWSFTVRPVYDPSASDQPITRLEITGREPVNVFTDQPVPPVVPIQGTTANTGGTIHGARTAYMAISAKDAAGEYSPLSNIVAVGIPAGTNTNTAAIPSITWDDGTTDYSVFAGIHPNALSHQVDGSGTPSSVTITALNENTYGAPDSEFDRLRFRVKKIWHGGVWGAQVVSVTSTTIKLAVGTPLIVNRYAGYDVTWAGKIDSQAIQPLASFRVASNTGDTLTLTSSPDPVALGLALGDVVIMRSMPTFGTDGTGDYISDATWASEFYPAGMTVDEEAGRIVRFIAGTGRGTTARVTSNTSTKLYCDFPVQPDSTSRYIVEDAKWDVVEDTDSLNNGDPAAIITSQVNVSNYVGQTVLVQALTLDGGENESVDGLSPIREIYIFGQGLVWKTVTADYVMTTADQAIAVDSTAGAVSVTLPPMLAGRTRSQRRIVKKISSDAHAVTVLPPSGADIDGAAGDVLSDAGDCVTYAGDEG